MKVMACSSRSVKKCDARVFLRSLTQLVGPLHSSLTGMLEIVVQFFPLRHAGPPNQILKDVLHCNFRLRAFSAFEGRQLNSTSIPSEEVIQ